MPYKLLKRQQEGTETSVSHQVAFSYIVLKVLEEGSLCQCPFQLRRLLRQKYQVHHVQSITNRQHKCKTSNANHTLSTQAAISKTVTTVLHTACIRGR